MTAQQARIEAEKSLREIATVELKAIRSSIEKAVKEGGFSIQVKSLSQAATKLLRNEDYKVESFSDPREHESWTTISW